jgi:hypothetical protein
MKLRKKKNSTLQFEFPTFFLLLLLLLIEEELLFNKSCPRNFLVLQGYPNRLNLHI